MSLPNPTPPSPSPPAGTRSAQNPQTDHLDRAEQALRAGRLDEVARALEAAVQAGSRPPRLCWIAGRLHRERGDFDGALRWFERLRDAPDPVQQAEGWYQMGLTRHLRGELRPAVEAYRRSLALRPDEPNGWHNLGVAWQTLGEPAEALTCFRAELKLRPDRASAWNNAGNCLLFLNRLDEAEQHYGEALKINKDDPDAWNNLGTLHRMQGRLELAEQSHRRAIQGKPAFGEAWSNLGTVLRQRGDNHAAVAAFRRALECSPAAHFAHSNLLLALHYLPETTPQQLLAEHRRWAARHAPRAAAARPTELPSTPARLPGRPIRVGYVSPDFRQHSVAAFLEPLLRHHDPERVELFAYAEVPVDDETTSRLRGLVSHWRKTCGLSDAALAERIAADGIDVLVDLAGHTARNRLTMFARRPAAVQVSYLGYGGTTGLAEIDARLTDAVADPPGAEGGYVERLVRLPGCSWCFQPPAAAPPPDRACGADRGVTFGACHPLTKISDPLLLAWRDLLARLPGAVLKLKTRALGDRATRGRFLERCTRLGLPSDRIELQGFDADPSEHLAFYRRIDVALDAWPYNGATTTCEALFMGVPVATWCGDRYVQRMGASLLTALGRAEWIASGAEEYVEIAAQLARETAGRAGAREELRDEFLKSPICDGARLAREIESAFTRLLDPEAKAERPRPPIVSSAEEPLDRLCEQASQAFEAGHWMEAARLYETIVDRRPDLAAAWNNLGSARERLNDLEGAALAFARAAGLDAAIPEFRFNLGVVQQRRGLWEQARAEFAAAVALRENVAAWQFSLGLACEQCGALPEAHAAYAACLKIDPRHFEARVNIGRSFARHGQTDAALAQYEAALQLRPDSAEAWSNLGVLHRNAGRLSLAERCLLRAAELQPGIAEIQNNLGSLRHLQGRPSEAAECFRRALALRPDFEEAQSNLLMTLAYDPASTSETLAAAHRRWGAAVERDIAARAAADPGGVRPRPPCAARGKLRIGYVSPDFRAHAVAFFLEPLLRTHDRRRFEILAYSDVAAPDDVTRRLQALFDGWRPIVGRSHDDVARLVRADRVDLLVDLAGHTAHNRMGLFARRPAPRQIAWLGYGSTTGLTAFDGRLTDAVADPPGSEVHYTEPLIRIPGGFMCYQPPAEAPPAVPADSAGSRRRPLTFGAFHNRAKISPACLDGWARILHAVPGSRLLVKTRVFVDEPSRQEFARELIARGVADDRFELRPPRAGLSEHLAAFHDVDLALDSFPYTGATLTCEALWMGVPVLTRVGETFVGRLAASLLATAGIEGCTARTEEEWAVLAASWAERLRSSPLDRAQFRDRVARSPLCDGPAFARRFEAALGELGVT